MKSWFEIYKKRAASKPHLIVGYSGEYEDSACKTSNMLSESHVSLEHVEGNKYTLTVEAIYYTLTEEVMQQYVCNNVKAGKKYPASFVILKGE